jgi:flagellar motility protein MotE (MotC chaperone)
MKWSKLESLAWKMSRELIMKVLLVLLLSSYGFFIFSQETETKTEEIKKYSQSEFNKAVMERVTKELKLSGKGKIVSFSNELMVKEENLSLKELEIKKREEELAQTEKTFEKRVKQFRTEQTKILGCLDGIDKAKSKRISHMVSVISGMKPVTAASVLSVQEAGLSVQILGLLAPEKVSKIFNSMDKEISARLQKQYMTMKR